MPRANRSPPKPGPPSSRSGQLAVLVLICVGALAYGNSLSASELIAAGDHQAAVDHLREALSDAPRAHYLWTFPHCFGSIDFPSTAHICAPCDPQKPDPTPW